MSQELSKLVRQEDKISIVSEKKPTTQINIDSHSQPTLYLIPTGMSDAPLHNVIPDYNIAIIKEIRHFIVENVRSARRFIKRCDPGADISGFTFYELNRHTEISEVNSFLNPLRSGFSMGIMSDAGCPAVADPGALPVAIAQREGLKVTPLVGPSSILMSLMASGFNGQGFTFHGYLPIEEDKKAEMLRRIEKESKRYNMTQIFIETPYRNNKMLRFLCNNLDGTTKICVACDISSLENETIITRTSSEWRKILADERQSIDLDKRPAIFLLYAGVQESVQQLKNKKSRK